MNLVDTGEGMSIKSWKTYVTSLVMGRDIRNIKIKCKLYISLNNLKLDVHLSHNMLCWWKLAYRRQALTKHCKTIVKALLNVYRYGTERCHICQDYDRNSVEHIMFTCSSLHNTRVDKWRNVIRDCPPQMINEFNCMTEHQRWYFMLNCFNCDFVPEWVELYASVSTYISCMFKEYWHKSHDT